MDGNITKALWLGVGILFFVVVVSSGLFLLNQGKDMVNTQSKNISESEKKLNESKFSQYDNGKVNGAQVLSLIKEHQDNGGLILIRVTTKKSTNIQYISTGTVDANFLVGTLAKPAMSAIKASIKNANDESHNNYISPVAEFYSQVAKDENGQIRAVLVEQN